jgi:hypothetical protein
MACEMKTLAFPPFKSCLIWLLATAGALCVRKFHEET